MTTFVIKPRGPFSLREAALFGFGPRTEKRFDGVMRLAFCADRTFEQVAVELTQSPDGAVHACVAGHADVRDQVARILSLDHDGEAFLEVGRRDPVIGRLQAAAPGLRPVLFHSPYEAAAWAVLSGRRGRTQAINVRNWLARTHGRELAGQWAFPTPTDLLKVTGIPSFPAQRLDWLHKVAEAALDGWLDAATLRARDPDEAMADLRRLPGIGPFYAALVQVRATGATDILPVDEPRSLAAAGELYGQPFTQRDLEARAEQWRPFRTWATVLIRAVTPRVTRHPERRS